MPRLSRGPARGVPGGRPAARVLAALVAVVALGLALTACRPTLGGAAGTPDGGPAEELRLGYFPTVTHAPALVGVARGTFAEALGDTTLSTQVFGAGPAAIEALSAGAIDVGFLGPNPALTGFLRSDGEGLRVVAGVASGGAQLVVRPEIESAADLVGGTLASPQLGGTQDVALRAWLADQGLETRLRGGGDVSVTPTANAQALQLFRDGSLDGVWAPEPWASRLVLEAGGEVLVDERDLWPQGRFPTTYLVVSSAFLTEHPDTVAALLAGLLDTFDWMDARPEDAAALVDATLEDLTGQALEPAVLERALGGVEFGPDPLAATLVELHRDAVRVGTVPDAPLRGILDLRLLDPALAERGGAAVSDAGLGQDRPVEPRGEE